MKKEGFFKRTNSLCDAMEKEISEDSGFDMNEFKDYMVKLPITDAAVIQKKLADLVDRIGKLKSIVQVMYDFTRYSAVPGIMDIEGIESIRVEGVGNVYLLSDLNVSTRADKKEAAISWLLENGFGDVIKETVNSSSLKGIIKTVIKNGETVVPEEIFNVSAFTRSQITK